MEAGKLNRRITVQKPSDTQDAFGQPVEAWIKAFDTWASIRFANGLQAIRGDSDTSTIKASIRIRYRSDIDASMRVLSGNLLFNVLAVLPDEVKREYVDLVCEVHQ